MQERDVHGVARGPAVPVKPLSRPLLVGLGLFLLAPAACRQKASIRKPMPLELSFAAPDGSVPRRDLAATAPAAYVELARTALDAAKKIASGCRFREAPGWGVTRFNDTCDGVKSPDVAALHEARKALDASPLAPDAGFSVVFVKRLWFFDDAVAGSFGSGYWQWTGTLARYQDLARAWNDWQPDAPTELDVVKLPDRARTSVDDGGMVQWKRSSDGPAVIVDAPP